MTIFSAFEKKAAPLQQEDGCGTEVSFMHFLSIGQAYPQLPSVQGRVAQVAGANFALIGRA